MPSTYTSSLRFNLQGAGDNLNTWGLILNSGVFALVDTSIAGRYAFTLSGSATLSSANGSVDQSRNAILDITGGSGGTLTVPAVSKLYYVKNAASNSVILTCGAGSATVESGEASFVMCDGGNVTKLAPKGFPLPVNATDPSNKLYVDNTAFEMAAGALPGQTGNSGKVLGTDGTSAGWVPALPPPSFKTASFTAEDKGRYPIDTAAGVVIMTLPASPQNGAYVQAWDAGVTLAYNGFATNKLTIARNGSTINGIADDVDCTTLGAGLTFEFVNSTWSIRNAC